MREIIKNIFNVVAFWNPFTQVVIINYKNTFGYHSEYESKEFTYQEVDEWNSFSTIVDGLEKTYDIHIHYDESPSISIYEVINNNVDTSKEIEVELIIKY